MNSTDNELVRHLRDRAPAFYAASLFAPSNQRDGFRVIAAFLMEMEHVLQNATDPMMSAIRFTWWAEQLEAMPEGRVERHPLNEGLLALVEQNEALSAPLLAMVHSAHDALDNKDNAFLYLDHRKALWVNMVLSSGSVLAGGADGAHSKKLGEALFDHMMTDAEVDKSLIAGLPKKWMPLALPLHHKGKRGPVGPLSLLNMMWKALRS